MITDQDSVAQPRRAGSHLLSLAACCLLLLTSLAGCGTTPTPKTIAEVSPTVPAPLPSPLPSSTPGLTATWTALPTVPVAQSSAVPARTATFTATPSATASETATATDTPSPTPTVTPSAAPAATNTSAPATTTITPTRTITPTPTPTLTPTPLFTPTPLPTVSAAASKDLVNLLLIGLDSTHNLGAQNTDVIIVVVINKETKQVSMLSIPRDLWVYIPTYGWSRINIAHKIGHRTGYPGGGPGLLMETIRVNFGIPLDHWARVDFQGFTRAIDKLGGVDITVSCPINLRYMPPNSDQEEEMILEPGVYHMDGATALRYVRTRRDATDFDRARRQQQFLKAVWYQFKDAGLIPQIGALWTGLKDSLETDLDLGDILSLAPLALDIKPQRIRNRYIGPDQTRDWTNADGWRVLLPDYEKIQQVVASLYTPQSGEDPVAGEGARIQVRNGTYRAQLAMIAADQLRWEGLNVVDTGPADTPDYAQTRILVFNDKPKTVEALAKLLKVKPANIVHQLDAGQPADILVILGNDYNPCQ
jgi:LCP family protein required for cell wall assembly